MYTRRDFGKLALAGVPVSFALGRRALASGRIDSTFGGVRMGACSYSFRDFPRMVGKDNVDAIIQALKECNAGVTELFSPNVEPASAASMWRPPRAAGGGPDREAMRAHMNSPEMKQAREDLRKWRTSTPIGHFRAIRKKFDDAGIDVYAYTMNYRDDFTDDEIDATFEQAKGLGVKAIASSMQLSFAKRLAPFADKHKIVVAVHGHSNTRDPNEFSSPETFATALQMSKYFKVNLDIGHFAAAGFDPVAFIKENHENITHLHIKDRKKDDGPNRPFGEGDTPIKPVLLLLKEQRYPIPALVEYEYQGTESSVEEVKKCLAYMKQAVA
jgi:sugar phosphate isomerase/epimerase